MKHTNVSNALSSLYDDLMRVSLMQSHDWMYILQYNAEKIQLVKFQSSVIFISLPKF